MEYMTLEGVNNQDFEKSQRDSERCTCLYSTDLFQNKEESHCTK